MQYIEAKHTLTSVKSVLIITVVWNFSNKVTEYTYYVTIVDCKKSLFEDTKGVIRISHSMKDRQHNGQKKKNKGTNINLQNLYIKLMIE
jgi:hypothetical protein